MARGRWNGSALVDTKDIFTAGAGVNGPARMVFDRDGMLYVTTGGVNGTVAQDPNSLAGKVLRLKDDGTVPPDNPFVGKTGARPEVFTLGHRSSLGMGVHPGTGQVWQHENGPNGGDEINILKPGANYGWPIVSLGRAYPGNWQSDVFSHAGHRAADRVLDTVHCRVGHRVLHRRPPAEVEGRRVRRQPAHRRDSWHRPPRAHPLQREDGGAAPRVAAHHLRQRIRDVRQGPDGLLYVVSDHPKDGAILRIEPGEYAALATSLCDLGARSP